MYEDITYETILERMLDRVPERFDKREGSVIYDAHSPAAIELQLLYLELDNIISESYGDTAKRDNLILRCQERGITPYPGTNAVLKGEFTPPDIDVLGKRFNLGSENYEVTEKIADGLYKVRCEEAGTAGNQQLGAMIPIEYIEGLETAELTEVLIPGEDEEETEQLRKRYFNSFDEMAFGGNMADYLEKTNAISGVGSTKVTRVWNGDISPSAMVPTAAVDTWYSGTIGSLDSPVAAWLETVYKAAKERKLTAGGTVLLTITDSEYGKASDALVDAVQEIIDPKDNGGEGYGLAPVGHFVTVKSADTVSVNVQTSLSFDTGYSWSNLQSSINSAIESYLLSLRKEWADTDHLVVRLSQIETRLLAVRGIIDVNDTKINGLADNLTLGKYEIPVFGGASE